MLYVVLYLMALLESVKNIFTFLFHSTMLCFSAFQKLYTKPVYTGHRSPNNSFLLNRYIEHAIRASVLDRTCGVHVLWAPVRYGKTAAIHNVLRELQDKKQIRGAIILRASKLSKSDLQRSLCDAIRINCTKGSKLETINDHLISYPYHYPLTIAIDEFDCFRNADVDQLERFVHDLAQESSYAKRFNVLISLNNYEFSKRILSHGNSAKIRRALANSF